MNANKHTQMADLREAAVIVLIHTWLTTSSTQDQNSDKVRRNHSSINSTQHLIALLFIMPIFMISQNIFLPKEQEKRAQMKKEQIAYISHRNL